VLTLTKALTIIVVTIRGSSLKIRLIANRFLSFIQHLPPLKTVSCAFPDLRIVRPVASTRRAVLLQQKKAGVSAGPSFSTLAGDTILPRLLSHVFATLSTFVVLSRRSA
jgi:hypothetical protein